MTKWILATLLEGAGYLSRSSAISNSLKNILWRFKCVKLENYDCVLSISVSTIDGLKYSPVNAHRSGNIYNIFNFRSYSPVKVCRCHFSVMFKQIRFVGFSHFQTNFGSY